jgi:hypothetical protein
MGWVDLRLHPLIPTAPTQSNYTSRSIYLLGEMLGGWFVGSGDLTHPTLRVPLRGGDFSVCGFIMGPIVPPYNRFYGSTIDR